MPSSIDLTNPDTLRAPVIDAIVDVSRIPTPLESQWRINLQRLLKYLSQADTTYGTQAERLLTQNSATLLPNGKIWIETDTGNTVYQNRLVNGIQRWVPLVTIPDGTFSTNWDWTSPSGSVSGNWNFVNVPAGKSVQLLRLYGNWIAWPLGAVTAGDNTGVALKIMNTNAGQSPFVGVGLGNQGVYLTQEAGMAQNPVTIPFDVDVSASNPLEADNIMVQEFLIIDNTTGLDIHLEAEMVVEFAYVDA